MFDADTLQSEQGEQCSPPKRGRGRPRKTNRPPLPSYGPPLEVGDAVEQQTLPMAPGRRRRVGPASPFVPAPTEHRRPIVPEPDVPDPGRTERLSRAAGKLIGRELAASRNILSIEALQLLERQRVDALASDDRAAAMARAAASAGILRDDRGAPGEASRARQQALTPAADAGVEAVEAVEAVEVLRACPLHQMDLSEDAFDTSLDLARMWRLALPIIELPGGYGNGGKAGRRHLSSEEEGKARAGWASYREAITLVITRYGHAHADALRDAVVMEEEATEWRVLEALGFLALMWEPA